MKYRNIVFDIDGTLIDTEKAILLSLQTVLAELQHKTMELADLRFALGIPGRDALVQLGIVDLSYAHARWDEIFQRSSAAIRVFAGIEPVLQQLKANSYALGIITSKTKKEYQDSFCPFGMGHYFDRVICVEDSIKHKPDPEPMLRYLEAVQADPGEVLYIGDTRYDMQCAGGAGVDSALALWGCPNPQNIQATYYFKYPGDLLGVLAED